MPIFFAALLGRSAGSLLGRVVLSHAVLTMAFWCGLSAAAFWLAERNLGRGMGPLAALLVPMALLAWTLWRPAESRVKMWLFEGLYVWMRLGFAWSVVMAVARLVAVGGSLPRWLPDGWRYLLAGGVFWMLQRTLVGWLRRSHVRAGDLSLVSE